MKDEFQLIRFPTLCSTYILNSSPNSANFLTIEPLFYPMSGVINIHYRNVFNSVEYINIDIFQSLSLYDRHYYGSLLIGVDFCVE